MATTGRITVELELEADAGAVSVRSRDGERFTYVPEARVESVQPASGPTRGGTEEEALQPTLEQCEAKLAVHVAESTHWIAAQALLAFEAKARAARPTSSGSRPTT